MNYFKRWYEKHKLELSEKRKQRYRNDPEYRARIIERNKERRKRLPKLRDTIPPEYVCNLKNAAPLIGVSEWNLRFWCNKGLFPLPSRFGRGYYLTQNQIDLLRELAEFLKVNRVKSYKRNERLQELVDYIFANWNSR